MGKKQTIINDYYFKDVKKYLTKQGELFEEYISRYTYILDNVVCLSIMKGKTSDSINKFKCSVEMLKGNFEYVCDECISNIDSFSEGIDDIDQFLY